MLLFGIQSVRISVPAFFASVSRFTLNPGLSRKSGLSARRPAVTDMRGVMFQRSCAYADISWPRNFAAMSPPFAYENAYPDGAGTACVSEFRFGNSHAPLPAPLRKKL